MDQYILTIALVFQEVCLRPFLDLGNHDERILYGPQIIIDQVTFNPSTIDVSHV